MYHDWVLIKSNSLSSDNVASNWVKIWGYYNTASPCTAAAWGPNYENLCSLSPIEDCAKSGILSCAIFSHQMFCNAYRDRNNKLTALRLMIYCEYLQWVPCLPHLFLSLASLVPLDPFLEDGSRWPGSCRAYHLCSWIPSWGLKEEVEFLELPKAIIMITIIITENRLW